MIDLAALPWSALLPFIIVGFVAQLVDGTCGAAFGLVSRAILVLIGVPPVAASAATHGVESFTSGVSGLAHAMQRNVDWSLFARLVVPGVIGGLLGVWVLTFADLAILQPVLVVYMAAIGAYLVWRAPRRPQTYRRIKFTRSLGLFGGFLDASGGGWGPVVAGGLLAQGTNPRQAIGTANAAEFFVTVTILAAFLGTMDFEMFTGAVAGLLIGGTAAAPLSAFLVRAIAPRVLTRLTGFVLLGASLYGIIVLMFENVAAFPRF